jgi:hypothetical protein
VRPFYLNKLDYGRKSMTNVVDRHITLSKITPKEGMDIEVIKNLQIDTENYNQFLKDIDNKDRLIKEKKYTDDELLDNIRKTLSLENLTLEDKQLSIEKTCLSYDQN